MEFIFDNQVDVSYTTHSRIKLFGELIWDVGADMLTEEGTG